MKLSKRMGRFVANTVQEVEAAGIDSEHAEFNEDMIVRRRLPADVRSLLHDLCYHHRGRDVFGYVRRAQDILKRKHSPFVKGYSR